MEVLRTPEEARRFTLSLRAGPRTAKSSTVGIVPTMGALHEGHLSLLRLSNQTCDATLATIFVNPTQFGPQEDLDKYPRTFERDCQLLEAEGVAAVFVPSNESMYPDRLQHLRRAARSRQVTRRDLSPRALSRRDHDRDEVVSMLACDACLLWQQGLPTVESDRGDGPRLKRRHRDRRRRDDSRIGRACP